MFKDKALQIAESQLLSLMLRFPLCINTIYDQCDPHEQPDCEHD